MTAPRLRVLVVDDSRFVLEHVKITLEGAGHIVTTRESALGTVQQVVELRPDVLVLDVSMPALDGDRLVSVVAQVDDWIRIILHSSRPPHELEQIARTAGAHGAITKDPDPGLFLLQFNRIAFASIRKKTPTSKR
jgi:CheY-like chemotaxis protein